MKKIDVHLSQLCRHVYAKKKMDFGRINSMQYSLCLVERPRMSSAGTTGIQCGQIFVLKRKRRAID